MIRKVPRAHRTVNFRGSVPAFGALLVATFGYAATGSSGPLISAGPFFFCPAILEEAMLVVDILYQEAEANSADDDIEG
jgi:hypothetical protein